MHPAWPLFPFNLAVPAVRHPPIPANHLPCSPWLNLVAALLTSSPAQGSTLANASNQVIANRLFPGAAYPDKLEAYQHRSAAPGTATLAADLRGSWAVQYDAFKGIAQVRSLLWPGYFFFYSANDLMWGSLYAGDGLRNNDLIFML